MTPHLTRRGRGWAVKVPDSGFGGLGSNPGSGCYYLSLLLNTKVVDSVSNLETTDGSPLCGRLVYVRDPTAVVENVNLVTLRVEISPTLLGVRSTRSTARWCHSVAADFFPRFEKQLAKFVTAHVSCVCICA